MIKIVPDANVILSGMLGPTATRKILDFALAKRIVLFGSEKTYAEFCEKIKIERFSKYLAKQIFTPDKIILDYKLLINMVDSRNIYKDTNITKDSDDDEYFRVAKATGCRLIVTRDHHLLDVKKYDDILVVKPEEFLKSFFKIN